MPNRAPSRLAAVLDVGMRTAALKIGGRDAATGAHPSYGMASDAELADLSRPILKDRPTNYANDVARKIWGGTWYEEDKYRRKQIAEEVLVLVFPGRRQNDGVTRVIDASNIAKFVAVVNAKLQRPAAAAAPAPPPAKKHRKNKPRAPIPRDDTTDEEEDPPPSPPDRFTELPPEIVTLLLTVVVVKDEPCTRLEELCSVHPQIASLCNSGQLYESVNKYLGWTGIGSAKDIFKQNCKRQFLLPTFIGKLPVGTMGVRKGRAIYKDVYLIGTDFQKRIFLSKYAVTRFLDNEVEIFYDVAAQCGYGDVEDGDWEAAGITMEMSDGIVVGRELLEPLEESWNKITAFWRSKGIDDDDVVILAAPDVNDDDLKELYEEVFYDYGSQGDDELNKDGFNRVLERFVTAALTEKPDEDEDMSGDDEDDEDDAGSSMNQPD